MACASSHGVTRSTERGGVLGTAKQQDARVPCAVCGQLFGAYFLEDGVCLGCEDRLNGRVDLTDGDPPVPRAFSREWQERLDLLLAWFVDAYRSDLWAEMGLTGALTPSEVGTWLHTQARTQERAGDRLRIIIPSSARPRRPSSRTGSPSLAAEDFDSFEAVQEYVMTSAGHVDVFAGKYLRHDPSDKRVSSFGAPLYRLASAILYLDDLTGCGRDQALMFALADLRPTVPLFLARYRHGTLTMRAGVLTDSQTIRAWYAHLRHLGIKMRPKDHGKRRGSDAYSELRELVREYPEWTWPQRWEEWRERYPEGHPWHDKYRSHASMSETHRQREKAKKKGGE